MGAIVTIPTKKQSYDDIDKIIHTENPICPDCVREREQFENQKVEYNMKYDINVLALNKPDFIHTDIVYDIYKKSVQNRIDKIRRNNSTVFRVTPEEYKYIGRNIYDDYMSNHVNQSMIVDMNVQMRCNFIMGQKIIYTDKSVKYELYLLYFLDRIVFFIFVLIDTDYKLYFKEYFFELNCNLYSKLLKKKKIQAVIDDTFEKYFMYMMIKVKVLEEVEEEYYLSFVKNDIESKFKIIDLKDMSVLPIENRLIKNPIFEFHFLIENQIIRIRHIM